MKETLKMMRTIITGCEKDKTINELLQEYKEHESPNILAYLFVNNFGAIQLFSSNYKLLDTQDIASFSLQELDKAIKQYDFNSSCKFTTFFIACLKNRLRSEQELLMKNVRKANYYTEDISILNDIADTFEFENFDLNNYCLDEKEIIQCKLLLEGYTIKEIADILGLTNMAIYNRNKKIGKKLLI